MIVYLLFIAFILYSFIEPYLIQVKITKETNNNIPDAFNGLKIVFVSDIHYSRFYAAGRVRSLVEKVNDLEPDIVILGGDYANNREYIRPCFDVLKDIKPRIAKFGVLGNHDHWNDKDLTIQCMENAEITLLDNTSRWLYQDGSGIKIGGVGDRWTDTQILGPTINDVSEKDYVILVSHNPDFVTDIHAKKVDLVLSGHTHGGQITLFGMGLEEANTGRVYMKLQVQNYLSPMALVHL